MFQFPRFAFVSYVFRYKYLHVISVNPTIPQKQPARASRRPRTSELQISKVGFPIRKFTDQSLFAAPHDLSQRTTSFIASQRQGIHRIPLRHLIALIIDAHRSAAAHCPSCSAKTTDTSIERPFASNTSESPAVCMAHAGRSPWRPLRTNQTIGCVSSSR